MPNTKLVNGNRVPLTADEVTERENARQVYESQTTQRCLDRLKIRFQTARNKGTMVNLGGANVPVATTNDAVQELSAMLNRLTANGGTQRAVTRSDVVVEWTAEFAETALTGVEDYVAACYENEATLAEDITTAEDPTTVDLDAGWPV
jgi:hypothetical protein